MEPRFFEKQFKKWAAMRKLNLRRTPDGKDFHFFPAKLAWHSWQVRSMLATSNEDAEIFNRALQLASEVAFNMAGKEVAQAIQNLKIKE
jgi:hypothetical protein